ncbi:hypothetical protein GCM10010232_47570 [Streptomyces amakusaensis]
MVERLRPLVEACQDREQGAVRFRPATWRPWLEPHGATRVLSAGTPAPGFPAGDRLITRMDLATLRDRADDCPDGLRDLFTATMIWGSGTSNGRGPRHTAAALSDPRLPLALRTTRDAVRAGELRRAYERFAVRGVGRSFFTKWFAAADDRDAASPRALILDDRVLRSLNRLGWSSATAAGSRRRSLRYVTYVQSMHAWAEPLSLDASRLEWIMFELNGQVNAGTGSPTARSAGHNPSE